MPDIMVLLKNLIDKTFHNKNPYKKFSVRKKQQLKIMIIFQVHFLVKLFFLVGIEEDDGGKGRLDRISHIVGHTIRFYLVKIIVKPPPFHHQDRPMCLFQSLSAVLACQLT